MAMAALTGLAIDGSMLEGGGQLLRNAVALSALLSKPISIKNIRQGRKVAGLKPQHEAGLRLAAEICSASISGNRVGSTSITFIPDGIHLPIHASADTGTAGSTALLLQIALPCLLFSRNALPEPSILTLRGGTNALSAPQIDYTHHVLLHFMQHRLGLAPQLTIKRRGYYPKGGGEIMFALLPTGGPLPAVNLTDPGPVTTVHGRAYVAGLPAEIARRMQAAATRALVAAGINKSSIDIEALREKAADVRGSGSGIVLWAETEAGCVLGGSAIGMKGREAEDVGREAAEELLRSVGVKACVDEYLQDQMIVFLALAEGVSTVKTGPVTLHTKTAIWVAEQLTDVKFEVEEEDGGKTAIIRCKGIGFVPS